VRLCWSGVRVAGCSLQPGNYKKYNKIISDIQLVLYSSVITMMHGPINIRLSYLFDTS